MCLCVSISGSFDNFYLKKKGEEEEAEEEEKTTTKKKFEICINFLLSNFDN